MDEGERKEIEVFNTALELSSGVEGAAYLEQACRDEPALRQKVEALLQVQTDAEAFFKEVKDNCAGCAPVGAEGPGGTPAVTPLTEGPGTLIGRYKILEKIGEGGFGVVYVAEQREPVKRRVALKIIKLGMDTRQIVARFEAERQALALMDHPNIAKVFDAGATETGRPFFVMELVKGIPITKYCDQEKTERTERLKLFIQVCHAIQHAHQKGIIHRDIKPSNILVTLHDGVPVPMVIDFGIAKATQRELTEQTIYTQFQQFIGTPAYMSPEQAELSGLDIDTRSDIYSLGVLLYELLTGSTPFDTKELLQSGLDEMRKIIREREPVRPSTRVTRETKHGAVPSAVRGGMSAVDSDLDWIVLKCLEKDRRRRYETANGVATDIERHLKHEPVVARPPSLGYRLQKSFRRNRVVFTAAGLVGLALLFGALVSTWQAIRATRAGRREAAAHVQADQAARVAESQRVRADQERMRAERHLYAANMNLAQQAWEHNDVGRVRGLLTETGTYPARGFEWYYWQRQTHLELKTLYGHSAAIRSVAFSPDGQRIVTGSDDLTARVWEAAGGKELLTLRGHVAGIWSVAFSPDGQRIVTGSADQTAKVWDASGGKELLTLNGHVAGIRSVAFSQDGQRIVTGSLDATAKVWEAATGKEVLLLTGQSGQINAVAFSPDGRRIFTGSQDATVKVWEAATGKEVVVLTGQSGQINAVAFSPDGKRIVTGSADQTAKVWDAASGTYLLTLTGHSDGITSVAFSPDGQRIVTGSSNQTARIWDAASGMELVTLKGHSDSLTSVAFSPDGQRIVTGSQDATAKVWEAAGSKELLALKGHGAGIACLAFSPEGQRIVGSWDTAAAVWEAATGRKLASLPEHSAFISWVGFSPDGQRVATSSWDETVKVWDVASRNLLLGVKGHCVAFSPDGRRIVTGNSLRVGTSRSDHAAIVWDAASGKELLTLRGHSAGIASVAFSPDGQRIVTGSEDQTAKVWDAASGTNLLTLTGHSAGIRSVAFSPDGQRIVTGSPDKTARLWDAGSGRELLSLKDHSNVVCSVAFSPDGQRIFTIGSDQTAGVWEAAAASQAATWQREEEAAGERLAALRRERVAAAERERALGAQDPGAIKRWLVLAPIAFEGGSSAAALQQEQIPHEAHLRPRAGDRVKVGQSERVWRAVPLEDCLVDFNSILGATTEWSLAYAVCYIRSEAERSGLLLKVASDDRSKVYLNEEEIHRCMVYTPEPDVVAGVKLRAGLNVLVFKVVNETGGWFGAIRFTDAAGQPVKGIRVGLDPDAKNDKTGQ